MILIFDHMKHSFWIFTQFQLRYISGRGASKFISLGRWELLSFSVISTHCMDGRHYESFLVSPSGSRIQTTVNFISVHLLSLSAWPVRGPRFWSGTWQRAAASPSPSLLFSFCQLCPAPLGTWADFWRPASLRSGNRSGDKQSVKYFWTPYFLIIWCDW